MANGEMLEEIQKILQGDSEMPQEVTNRMILAGLVQIHNNVCKMTERIEKLEQQKANSVLEAWRTWVQPIAMFVLMLLVSAVMSGKIRIP